MDKIILIVAFFLLSPLLWIYGKEVPLSDQKDIFDSLKDTSAIIFAILGAWIAVIYPKDLKAIFKADNQSEVENTLIFKKLIWSLIVITTSLILMILTLPVIGIIKNIHYFQYHRQILLGSLSVYMFALTLAQVYALLSTLVPNLKIMIDFSQLEKNKEVQKRNMPVEYDDKK